MKNIIYISFTILFCFIQELKGQDLGDKSWGIDWANVMGADEEMQISKIETDVLGNVYAIGTFLNTIKINSLSTSIVSKGKRDIFILKFDNKGNPQKIITIGGKGQDKANGITIGENGLIYLAGSFEDTLYLANDKNPLGISKGDLDMFWASLNNNLELIHLNAYGGKSEDEIYEIHYQNSFIWITGYYGNSIDLAPNQEGFDFQTKGFSDAFFAKYDLNGNCIWAKSINLVIVETTIVSALDSEGNLFLSGVFQSTCDFDPSEGQVFLSSVQNSIDVFFAKYDGNGKLEFVNRIGSSGLEHIFDLKIDNKNNILLTGYFQNTIDFDFARSTFKTLTTNSQSGYLVKYTNDGSIVFANKFDATAGYRQYELCLDNTNQIFLSGSFFNEARFDTQELPKIILSKGNSDIFIAKYTESGIFDFAIRIGEQNNEVAQAIACRAGKIYLAGQFDSRNLTLISPNNEVNIDGNGNKNVFVLAISWDFNQTQSYSLSGRIINQFRQLQAAKVILYKKTSEGIAISMKEIQSIDGSFKFSGLDAGIYTLMAEPNDKENYLSTYYVNKSSIKEANWVEIFGNTRDLDLKLISKNTSKMDGLAWAKVYTFQDNEMLNLKIISQQETHHTSELLIYDLLGNKMFYRSFHAQEMDKEQTVNVPLDWPSGVYWAVLMNPTQYAQTFKFSK